ncbi:hypothetical protein [Sphingomonas colocasiae]|uniref:DUF3558 domain-containing protein n=1 Tax=Sphingomonas colocasiae TaxID=1848973 RepID=A0ABS7PYF5_9SPHN|nr:hypothetical protein [Sphingomonas colocasiae]MBY8826341.1 hypothetical protein [Sphingomonas colocasiae]
MRNRTIVSLAAMAALAACGGDTPADGDTAAANATAANTAPAARGWDATNACALLDKGALGTALGDVVTETRLDLVHQPSAIEAATSECVYLLKNGGEARLMTRRSPIDDNTPEAMAQARKATASAMSAFTSKPVEDVPGLGKLAFFVPGINQMNVFLDEKRFIVLTIGTAPNDKAKALAVGLVEGMSH